MKTRPIEYLEDHIESIAGKEVIIQIPVEDSARYPHLYQYNGARGVAVAGYKELWGHTYTLKAIVKLKAHDLNIPISISLLHEIDPDNDKALLRLARFQLRLISEIKTININMVDCGDCGMPFLHPTGVSDLTCPYCLFEDDISSFPDTFAHINDEHRRS